MNKIKVNKVASFLNGKMVPDNELLVEFFFEAHIQKVADMDMILDFTVDAYQNGEWVEELSASYAHNDFVDEDDRWVKVVAGVFPQIVE